MLTNDDSHAHRQVAQQVKRHTWRIVSAFALLVIGAGQMACATRSIELTGARLASERGEGLVIEVDSREDLAALSSSGWAGELMLLYSVDGSKPSRDKFNEYDPKLQRCRLPFIGNLLTGESRGSAFISRWRIPLENELNTGGLTFSYSLRDGAQHVIALEVYGANMAGRHVRSNELTLTVQLSE